ncbi:MAG: fibronectin type III domain-containing protein [Bacteriovoracaceae bacterium]|nr:fibronectin type III domain-containing protein [Bacteriovoracaceae bacterium]
MKEILTLLILFHLFGCSNPSGSSDLVTPQNTNAIKENNSKVKITEIKLNDGLSFTQNTTVSLEVQATDATHIYISQKKDCSESISFVNFKTQFDIALDQNTENFISLKLKDAEGIETECKNLSIIHDTTPPEAPLTVTPAANASDIATDKSHWSEAVDNGPSGIKSYLYSVSTTQDESGIITGADWTDTEGLREFQITSGVNLTGATDYYTLIKSIDKAGNISTNYAISAAWNIIVSPEAISNLEASSRSVDKIVLGWSYPQDNGTAITDYQIQIKGGQFSNWTLIEKGVSVQTTADIINLTAQTNYEFKVRAFNGINYSAWSNTLNIETLPNLDFFQGGYKAINISGAPKSKIVSFDDNNEIYLDGSLLTTLDKAETFEFDSSEFSVIEASKAFYVAGKLGTGSGSNNQGNATWATQSWVGKEFYFNLTRMAPLKVKVYAFTQSEISISTGATLVDSQTVDADSGHIFTLSNYANYQLSSTGLIVAFIYGNAGGNIYDPQPLLPISTDILGFPSSTAKVTSGSNNNNYNLYHSNNVSSTGAMNATNTLSLSPQGTSSLYRSESLRIISEGPITANSNADSNGYCQAPFVPISMLKKRFGLNSTSNWLAFASDRPVNLTLTKPDGTTSQLSLSRNGTGKTPYKAYMGTDYPAGTIIEGDEKFQVWYQPYTTVYSGGEDETIMFGWDE